MTPDDLRELWSYDCPDCGHYAVSPHAGARGCLDAAQMGAEHRDVCPGKETSVKYVCPMCQRAAEWTDGPTVEAGDECDEFWCQTCGAETPLADCEVA